MSQTQMYTMNVRPRRQVTIPQELLAVLGVEEGDGLVVKKKGDEFVIKTNKQAALEAFRALQKAIQESGIPEEEFQKAVEKDRMRRYARKHS